MANFDFITNFVSGRKTAKMFIRKPIGGAGINGDDFAKELDFLVFNGVEEVIIDINSPGGQITEGFSMFSAIKDAPIKTITRVVGMAASMAGIISQAGDHRIILDYALFHAHGPQVPKGAKVDTTLIEKMLGSLKTMISNKSKLSEEEISEMLSKETVLTAVEAQKMGFFDEIERTKGIKPELMPSNDLEAIFEMANEFITNTNNMDKLSNLLALENASEEQLINSVKELQAEAEKVEGLSNDLEAKTKEVETLSNEVEALKTEKEEIENKISSLEESNKSLKVAAATELVENAIKAGKISKESGATWIEQATNDLEKTKELLGGVSSVATAADLNNEISEGEEVENRNDWDFQKWGQEDPKGLENMQNEDPEKFEKLFNEYVEA